MDVCCPLTSASHGKLSEEFVHSVGLKCARKVLSLRVRCVLAGCNVMMTEEGQCRAGGGMVGRSFLATMERLGYLGIPSGRNLLPFLIFRSGSVSSGVLGFVKCTICSCLPSRNSLIHRLHRPSPWVIGGILKHSTVRNPLSALVRRNDTGQNSPLHGDERGRFLMLSKRSSSIHHKSFKGHIHTSGYPLARDTTVTSDETKPRRQAGWAASGGPQLAIWAWPACLTTLGACLIHGDLALAPTSTVQSQVQRLRLL